jgi:hypothetical protein
MGAQQSTARASQRPLPGQTSTVANDLEGSKTVMFAKDTIAKGMPMMSNEAAPV